MAKRIGFIFPAAMVCSELLLVPLDADAPLADLHRDLARPRACERPLTVAELPLLAVAPGPQAAVRIGWPRPLRLSLC